FFARMDETLPASTEIAVSKAYTSAVLRKSTHEVGKLAQPGEPLYGIQHTHDGKIVLFGGGLPLRLNGNVVGAVGISGGTVEEDIQIAEAVVEALKTMEQWSKYIKKSLPSGYIQESQINQLGHKLQEALEQMRYPLPTGHIFILTGAICLSIHQT
ncbi:MAG: heme-binding protein, partial [Desulfobacterales bacterium]